MFFVQNFGLQKWYENKRMFDAPWYKNILCFRYLSTKEYIVVIEYNENFSGKTDANFAQAEHILGETEQLFGGFYVISISEESFGKQLAGANCLYGSNSAEALEIFYALPNETPMGADQYFKARKIFNGLGEWSFVPHDCADASAKVRGCVDFCRNGVVIMADGKDWGTFHYYQFLRQLDAILQHDPTQPFKAPEGFSETEYQKNLEKYLAWLKEKEKKEDERRERELAKLHPEETRPPERPRAHCLGTGVHKLFVVNGPGRYWFRVLRNYSFNTLVNGFQNAEKDLTKYNL